MFLQSGCDVIVIALALHPECQHEHLKSVKTYKYIGINNNLTRKPKL